MTSPMVINFYNSETNEREETFTRSFVPWKLLKVAVKLAKSLDPDNLSESDIDSLSGLVIAVFGDRFSSADLDEKADVTEMIAVLNQIVTRAKGININPTPPGK